jgi:hypothetical protein
MNMYKKVIALSALLSVACVSALTTVKPGQLTIGLNRYTAAAGTTAQNDNYLSVTANTGSTTVYSATGFHINVACAVAKLLNLKPVFVWYDFAYNNTSGSLSCSNALANDKIDAFFTVATATANCQQLSVANNIYGVADLIAIVGSDTPTLGFIFQAGAYGANPKNCDLQLAVQSAINYLSSSQTLTCYAVNNNNNVSTAASILPIGGVPGQNASTQDGFIPVVGSNTTYGCTTCPKALNFATISCLAQYVIDNDTCATAKNVTAGTIS